MNILQEVKFQLFEVIRTSWCMNSTMVVSEKVYFEEYISNHNIFVKTIVFRWGNDERRPHRLSVIPMYVIILYVMSSCGPNVGNQIPQFHLWCVDTFVEMWVKAWAAMLAVKRSAGVTPEVKLRNSILARKHINVRSTLVLKCPPVSLIFLKKIWIVFEYFLRYSRMAVIFEKPHLKAVNPVCRCETM